MLKYLGVAYLLFLAWQTWRDRSTMAIDEAGGTAVGVEGDHDGRADQPAQPEATIFFFAFLPQFVQPGRGDTLPRMLLLSAIFMAGSPSWCSRCTGSSRAALRRHVITRPRVVLWMRRSFAAAYVVLAGRLALQDR